MPEQLYRQFRADAAPPDQPARAAALSRLEAEIGRRRGGALRWRRRGLVLALAAAAATAVAVAWPTDRGGSNSVVKRAAAALTPPPGRILHVRADGHNIYTPFSESWQTTTGPLRIRSRVGGQNAAGPCTIEWSYDAGERTMATWDASTRTIYWNRVDERTERQIGFPDPLREIRAHLAAGRLREAGQQTVDGRRVIRLEPANGLRRASEGRVGDAVYAYLVDARTYEPVRWEISPTQWYDYTSYEYLPHDELTRQLLSLEAQHPGAPRVEGSPPDPAKACNFG
jgi:hypothetical protein